MIYKYLKKLRLKHQLPQTYLAKQLNMSRPTYLQIEKGDRDLTIGEVETLASVFNLTRDQFLNQHEPDIKLTVKPASKKLARKKPATIRISIHQQKIDKFKQVLLYILKKVGGKPNIGMTTLYKLLYFIDFDYYEKNEEQLMGLVYLKNRYGPTPLKFDLLIKQLIKKGDIEKIKSKFYQYDQAKYLINPEAKSDLSLLSGQEIDHINKELDRLSDLTANDLTNLSHKDVPWVTAEENKPIDYEAVFYRTSDTSVRNYDDPRN